MYDIIGDVHGHAAELEQLLQDLQYRQVQGVYRHSERRVIFLGDWIDRGPEIGRTLEIARSMVEAGSALAVLGNHEWNFLAFHTPDPAEQGAFLRRHTRKNLQQNQETRQQLSYADLRSSLEWFRTLPLWLDLPGVRIVHACWDPEALEVLSGWTSRSERHSDEFLVESCRPDSPVLSALEVTLKGKELALPAGLAFHDKDGHARSQTRVRWYRDPHGLTYGEYAWNDSVSCDTPLEPEVVTQARPYMETEKPLFLGHYWLRAERPAILATNVACVDYGVAKGGLLCAYRWQGEQRLTNDHFAWVPSRDALRSPHEKLATGGDPEPS